MLDLVQNGFHAIKHIRVFESMVARPHVLLTQVCIACELAWPRLLEHGLSSHAPNGPSSLLVVSAEYQFVVAIDFVAPTFVNVYFERASSCLSIQSEKTCSWDCFDRL
jgi:hypothetical protein